MLRPVPAERVNTLTHAIGFVLSVVGAAVLIPGVFSHDDPWRCVGCAVYTVALMGVYGSSTLSHSVSEPNLRRLFRMLDQGFIYLLIVGTYTPFALAYLRTGWWLVFLGLLWTMALLGFLSKILIAHRVECVAVWIYVLLGWLPIISAGALLDLVPASALWWMLIGGLCYTVGTIFLLNDSRVPHFHAVWHVFVMAGSAIHFFAIWHAVARAG